MRERKREIEIMEGGKVRRGREERNSQLARETLGECGITALTRL